MKQRIRNNVYEFLTPYTDVMCTKQYVRNSDTLYTSRAANAIEHTATHCNTLQHTATPTAMPPPDPPHRPLKQITYDWIMSDMRHCTTLQHTATHCNTNGHAAPCPTTLATEANHVWFSHEKLVISHMWISHFTYEALHHTVTHSNTLQHQQPCRSLPHHLSYLSISYMNKSCRIRGTATFCNKHCNILQQTLQHSATNTAIFCNKHWSQPFMNQSWHLWGTATLCNKHCNILQQTLQ